MLMNVVAIISLFIFNYKYSNKIERDENFCLTYLFWRGSPAVR